MDDNVWQIVKIYSTVQDAFIDLLYYIITRSLGDLRAPTSSSRPFGPLDLSFAPFGRSGQGTHASYIDYIRCFGYSWCSWNFVTDRQGDSRSTMRGWNLCIALTKYVFFVINPVTRPSSPHNISQYEYQRNIKRKNFDLFLIRKSASALKVKNGEKRIYYRIVT